MPSLNLRGFTTLSGVDSGALKDGKTSDVSTRVGGRSDYSQSFDNFTLTASATDSTLRTYEDFPGAKDAVLTLDTHKDDLSLGLGYDTGTKGFLASVGTSEGLTGTNLRLGGKDVTARTWWFQSDNTVRTEASFNLDINTKVWGAYTFGTNAATANRTFVNIKEREGFIIEPFTASIANQVVAISHTRDDLTFDAAYDIKKNAPYVSVGKRHDDKTAFKAGYSFKDEVALVEVAHKHNADLPALRVFVKTAAGANGFGKPSGGVILDKHFDL